MREREGLERQKNFFAVPEVKCRPSFLRVEKWRGRNGTWDFSPPPPCKEGHSPLPSPLSLYLPPFSEGGWRRFGLAVSRRFSQSGRGN